MIMLFVISTFCPYDVNEYDIIIHHIYFLSLRYYHIRYYYMIYVLFAHYNWSMIMLISVHCITFFSKLQLRF